MKKLLSVILSFMIVCGVFGSMAEYSDAYYDGVGTHYYEIKYKQGGRTKTQQVPTGNCTQYYIYRAKITTNKKAYTEKKIYKDSSWVNTGYYKVKKVNGKYYKFYKMQQINKEGDIYVIDSSVYKREVYIRGDVLKYYGNAVVIGKNCSVNGYTRDWLQTMGKKGTVYSVKKKWRLGYISC